MQLSKEVVFVFDWRELDMSPLTGETEREVER